MIKKRYMNTMIMIYVIVFFSLFCFSINIIYGNNNKINEQRDYEYEHYCDSIWENNPDYYFDVIMESYQYEQYIEKHGEWWKENKE